MQFKLESQMVMTLITYKQKNTFFLNKLLIYE